MSSLSHGWPLAFRGSIGLIGRSGHAALAVLLATSVALPAFAQQAPATADRQTIEAQLQELLATRKSLTKQMSDFDGRIAALEAQLHGAPAGPAAPAATQPAPAVTPGAVASAAPPLSTSEVAQVAPGEAEGDSHPEHPGNPRLGRAQEPGAGFVVRPNRPR